MNFDFINKKEFIIRAFAVWLILMIGGFLVIHFNLKSAQQPVKVEPSNTNITQAPEQVFRKRINGAVVNLESETNLFPVAIMVENHVDSWPQSGLEKADLVYEAQAESTITRFLAFYATTEEIDRIGPVRSARPYYLDWAQGYDAAYFHCGGSPAALAEIKKNNIKDVNEFFHPYFWRSDKKLAPHNVFTSSEMIQDMLTDREYNTPKEYRVWKYKDDAPLTDLPAPSEFTIKFSNGNVYDVTWKYNPQNNDYTRYQNKSQHQMDNGAVLKAKNIIVTVNKTKVLDEIGRKEIGTVGNGQAFIFRDGIMIKAKWIKESDTDREYCVDEAGNEVEFNGGTTWVEIIADESLLAF